MRSVAASELEARGGPEDRLGATINVMTAGVAFVIALIVYLRTLLPGVSFGDWAEAQMIPSRLGILHPTGYRCISYWGSCSA